jgi:hypothetical protein
VQFALFIVIIAIGLWLIFYKSFIKFGRKLNKHFKNIKDEIGRDE